MRSLIPASHAAVFTSFVRATSKAKKVTLLLFSAAVLLAGGATATATPTATATATPTAAPTPTPAPTCAPPPAGMVSWWPGDGNANDIQSGNNGINNGTYAAGNVGQAFSLDGINNFVEIPDSPSVSITGAISIDAWINPTTTAPAVQEILSKYDSLASQQSYSFEVRSGGGLRFAVYQTGDGSIVRYVDTASGLVPTGTFTHVAATFDPATQAIKIYVNGVDTNAALGAGSTIVSSIFDSTAAVRIGAVVNSGIWA